MSNHHSAILSPEVSLLLPFSRPPRPQTKSPRVWTWPRHLSNQFIRSCARMMLCKRHWRRHLTMSQRSSTLATPTTLLQSSSRMQAQPSNLKEISCSRLWKRLVMSWCQTIIPGPPHALHPLNLQRARTIHASKQVKFILYQQKRQKVKTVITLVLWTFSIKATSIAMCLKI